MLNFVENLLENERDPRSGPINDQDHSLSLSDPDRSLVLSHFLTNFLQNLASCHTAFSNSIFQTEVRKCFLADRINRAVGEICKCLRSARALS
jgi:hypothetical protein